MNGLRDFRRVLFREPVIFRSDRYDNGNLSGRRAVEFSRLVATRRHFVAAKVHRVALKGHSPTVSGPLQPIGCIYGQAGRPKSSNPG